MVSLHLPWLRAATDVTLVSAHIGRCLSLSGSPVRSDGMTHASIPTLRVR